ncbi:DsbA family protein [Actinomadura opuntiae]|uniref:DsbA family protein n=1 Tax=Actinomadura sp. OS1-43 TaxID=604315 RepID=UPI00255B33C3|nr:thioredoxin domain-containing protein [Actinomadura sp. OS1-43]MDL4821593.1 thioredoxin domain-containing protein [Actinomadura sp. OS1-43]
MSKAARERSARERLAAERRRQAARAKQRRLLSIVLGAVVAVAVIVVATVLVIDQKNKNGHAEAHKGALAPLSRQSDGSILMAKAGVTKPELEIFEDFQCPICKQFESATGSTVQQLAAEGKVKVVYRPFHLFGQQKDPVKTNSLRSAEAALCVPADKWISYHDALFKFQPAEGEKGFSPDDLVKWGKDVGVSDPNFEKCVRDEQKKSTVDSMTSYALQTRGIDGTPTVFLDGKKLDASQFMDPSALKVTIDAAAAVSGKK